MPQKSRRAPVLRPLIVILAFGFMLKGALHHQLGEDVFEARVVALKDGVGIDRLGGYLMQADPLTLAISHQIDAALAPGGLLHFGA